MKLSHVMLAGISAIALGAVAQPLETLNLLSIGNSFSWSATVYLPRIAESAGCRLVYEQASLGGWTLQSHWELAEKSEADPTFQPYGDDATGKFNLREKLESRRWDVITIQQASHESWRAKSFAPYAENLVAYVRQYAPDAEIVIQQTWSYEPGESRLAQWGIETNTMYAHLTANYLNLARQLHLRLIPTGLAVQIVRLAAIGTDQQLTMTGADRAHLSKPGEYLQACVWFAALFQRPVSEIQFVPDELTPSEARLLRDAAQAAVNLMPQLQ